MLPSTPKEAAALRNFNAWWASHGITDLGVISITSSRVWYTLTPKILDKIHELAQRGVLLRSSTGGHGVDAIDGFREDVAGPSAQLVLQPGFLEMDFDEHNPDRDAVSLFGHVFEVLRNKFFGAKTDPYKIAEGLRKRGLDV